MNFNKKGRLDKIEWGKNDIHKTDHFRQDRLHYGVLPFLGVFGFGCQECFAPWLVPLPFLSEPLSAKWWAWTLPSAGCDGQGLCENKGGGPQ